ncbi:MAG: VanZ family protein [Clostridia bacterium]|nr:VanZ family protein [Clostridia bacterium]
MTKKLIFFLLVIWILTIALVIFLFSAQTGTESGNVSRGLMEKIAELLRLEADGRERMHFLIRKAAHIAEYAVLGASVCVLLFYLADVRYLKRLSDLRAAVCALIFSFLFAVTDEIHQAFVPGRGPAFTDVLIDTVGAALGIAVIFCFGRHQRQKKKKQSSVKAKEDLS